MIVIIGIIRRSILLTSFRSSTPATTISFLDILFSALLAEDGCLDSKPRGKSVFSVRRWVAKWAQQSLTLVHVLAGTKKFSTEALMLEQISWGFDIVRHDGAGTGIGKLPRSVSSPYVSNQECGLFPCILRCCILDTEEGAPIKHSRKYLRCASAERKM